MKRKTHLLLTLSAVFLLTSCAPNILGTWNVVKYETIDNGEKGTVLNNIGTLTFEKKGLGQKDITYNVLGVQRVDNSPFTWKSNDSFVTIVSDSSDLSKTWILFKDAKKTQIWKATDGANQVQSLELKK